MAQPRTAFIGVGHPFLKDDRAGGLVIAELEKLFSSADARPLMINTAGSPENFLGPIVRYQPERLYLIDVVDLGMEPGAIISLEWTKDIQLDAQPFSLPLDKFCLFISMECQCPITLMGIQAQNIGYGSELSEPVQTAIQQLSHYLYSDWMEHNLPDSFSQD